MKFNNNSAKIKSIANFASIIIVSYNHRKYLEDCIQSIEKQDFPHELIIVDNGSTDGSIELIEKFFPHIQLILSEQNIGFGAANNVGADYATGDILVFLNPDTYVQKLWLSNLIYPLLIQDYTITTPKILTYDGKMINTCGNINHFTGLNFTRGYGLNPNQYQQSLNRGGVSGACFALKKKDFRELGGFDESFFLYNEDSDFSWNAFLNGYSILYIPNSIIYHNYNLNVSPQKLYQLETGRYLLLKKYYSYKMIFYFLPSFILVEIIVFFYALKLKNGGISYKFQAIRDGIQQTIKTKKIVPYNLFHQLDSRIPTDQLIKNSLERFFVIISNVIFLVNYRLIKWIQ